VANTTEARFNALRKTHPSVFPTIIPLPSGSEMDGHDDKGNNNDKTHTKIKY
jgi:hypothetical protein